MIEKELTVKIRIEQLELTVKNRIEQFRTEK